jgi:transposase-like protein
MDMSQLRYGGLPPRKPKKKSVPTTMGDQSEESSTRPCCPHCGKPLVGHGQRTRKSGAVVKRFQCRKCHYTLSVPPPTHALYRTTPEKDEEDAVLDYAAGKGVCARLADVYKVCTTTIWNWVNRTATAARSWIHSIPREILRYTPTAQIIPVPTEEIVQHMLVRRFRLPNRPQEIVQLLSVAKWSMQLQTQLVHLGWDVPPTPTPFQFCRQYFGHT